jgi:hypothetical protein
VEPERKASLVISKPPSPALPPGDQMPAASTPKDPHLIGARGATLLRRPQSAQSSSCVNLKAL